MAARTVELVIWLRSLGGMNSPRNEGLLGFPMRELQGYLQRLGQSGRGTREELEERLAREIWRAEWGHKIDAAKRTEGGK